MVACLVELVRAHSYLPSYTRTTLSPYLNRRGKLSHGLSCMPPWAPKRRQPLQPRKYSTAYRVKTPSPLLTGSRVDFRQCNVVARFVPYIRVRLWSMAGLEMSRPADTCVFLIIWTPA